MEFAMCWCCIFWLLAAFFEVRDYDQTQRALDKAYPVPSPFEPQIRMIATIIVVLIAPVLLPPCLLYDLLHQSDQ